MIELLKDRYKVGLFMATLFFLGIIVSTYQVYKLPHTLMLSDGFHPAMINIYVWLAITFLIGGFTIWSSLNSRNEIIVYREKQNNQNSSGASGADSEKTTISLDSVKENLRNINNEKDIISAGLHAVCKELAAGQGAVYLLKESDGKKNVELSGGYSLTMSESTTVSYGLGEGLIGQAAASGQTLYLDDVPDGYIKIISGLGSASPKYLLIVAIKHQDRISGVMEIASFTSISENQRKFVEEAAQLVADKVSGK
jgi:hypothetical protein